MSLYKLGIQDTPHPGELLAEKFGEYVGPLTSRFSDGREGVRRIRDFQDVYYKVGIHGMSPAPDPNPLVRAVELFSTLSDVVSLGLGIALLRATTRR